MASVQMSVEDYLRLLNAVEQGKQVVTDVVETASEVASVAKKTKKKASAYSKRYSAAFRKVRSKFQTKAGKWKKGGFKRAVKMAHKMAGGK